MVLPVGYSELKYSSIKLFYSNIEDIGLKKISLDPKFSITIKIPIYS